MRFLADMGISPKTVDFLRGEGHDAVHLHELGLDRMQDSGILRRARTEDRILLTHDLDFGGLIAASGARLPSVVVLRLRSMHPEAVNSHLSSVISQHAETLREGTIISVSEGKARVRLLPLDRST